MNNIINGLNSRRKVDYKNDLVSANEDYLELNSRIELQINESLVLNFFIDAMPTSTVSVVSDGNTGSYIALLATTGRVFIDSGTGTQNAAGTEVSVGENTITIRRDGSGDYFVKTNNLSEVAYGSLPNTDVFAFSQLGRRSSNYSDISFNYFSSGSDNFPLNEANGELFFSTGRTNVYKNVLVAANEDNLSTTTMSQNWVNRSEIDVEINGLHTSTGDNQLIFAIGNFDDPNTGLCQIWINSVGTINIYISDINDTNIYNTMFSTIPFDAEYNLKLVGLDILLNDVVVHTITSDASTKIDSNSKIVIGVNDTFWFWEGYVNNFRTGTETFSLNEALGAEFTGSLGTTGDRNTSHSDGIEYIDRVMIQPDGWSRGFRNTSHADGLDYINDVMIQRNPDSYKNDLVAANADYLIVDESLNWVNLSDVDVELNLKEFVMNGDTTLFSKGGFNKSTSGLFLININSETNIRILSTDVNNTSLSSSVLSFSSSNTKLKVKNLEVFIDDILVDTLTEQLVNLSTSLFKSTIGKLSYANIWYLNGSICDFKLGGETFHLNEVSGATFYGNHATLGTRHTSHEDGIEYIDDVMIQKIN